ncbi:hypothetical protein LY78DRAFT_479247 [Colletotrichum sublineola]|nr:hypothetical protein LY78DRAFT_479247 [Colletotrichum sublineola]
MMSLFSLLDSVYWREGDSAHAPVKRSSTHTHAPQKGHPPLRQGGAPFLRREAEFEACAKNSMVKQLHLAFHPFVNPSLTSPASRSHSVPTLPNHRRRSNSPCMSALPKFHPSSESRS